MTKYQEIFQELEKAIQGGQYAIGHYLPSEHQLAKHYKVSRDTVRKALRLLIEAGLIQKKQGQGSQVIDHQPINFPVSELTSYQELVQTLGMDSQTKLITLDKLIVDEKLAALTGFAPKSLLWRVTRQRLVDGVASVLDIDYLAKDLVPKMTKEIAQQSIYAYLEGQLKLDIAYAHKEITISPASQQDKILLDLGNDQHLVSIKSKVYLSDHQQFQFTESRHKLDKFRFVDFARRKH